MSPPTRRVLTFGPRTRVIPSWPGTTTDASSRGPKAPPIGTAKTFGDVWVGTYRNPGGTGGATKDDGKEFLRSIDVATGSSAPNLLGKFHDKTSLEVDRTGGPCDGNVYFAWARFTGGSSNGFNSSVYFSRSTDHGATFSAPMKLSQTVHDIQFPDIAVTGNGHVYVTYRQFADVHSHEPIDAIAYNKSTNCGATFSQPHVVQTFEPYDPTDLDLSGDVVGDCGDFASECQSGYTFMRGGTQRERLHRLRPDDPRHRGAERDVLRVDHFGGSAREVPPGRRERVGHLLLPPGRLE